MDPHLELGLSQPAGQHTGAGAKVYDPINTWFWLLRYWNRVGDAEAAGEWRRRWLNGVCPVSIRLKGGVNQVDR